MTAHRNTCPSCERPIIDAGRICHACTDSLRDTFIQIARLHHQLDITLTRQDRIGDPGKTSVEPLPFSWAGSEAAFAVNNALTTWTRHVEDERGTTMPDQRRPPRTAGPDCKRRWCDHESCAQIRRPLPPEATVQVRCALWLSTQVDWIRHRAEAQQIADEIHDTAALLVRTIDRTPPRQYVGPCDVCEADMYAPMHASQVSCPKGCEVTYTIADRRSWLLEKADDQIQHASLIARAITDLGEPIKSDRIRQWASRGRLLPRGQDDAGRPLYAVRDVRDLLRQDERRRAAKRPV